MYCVDFVADKIVSGGRDQTVKMFVTAKYAVTNVLTFFFQMEELTSDFLLICYTDAEISEVIQNATHRLLIADRSKNS